MVLTYWLAIGGGVTLLLAAALYFPGKKRSSIRLPASIIGVIGGFAVGVAVGLGLMVYYESEEAILGRERDLSKLVAGNSDNAPDTSKAPAPAAKAQQKKGGGMMGGGGGGGAPRGPSAQSQLTTLVIKIDQLSRKPLVLSFDDAHKAKIKDQLMGLGDLKTLTAEDAKKRLDGLLEQLKDQRETLEAAGYRWPGSPAPNAGGGMLPPPEPENPFKLEDNRAHLDSVNKSLSGK